MSCLRSTVVLAARLLPAALRDPHISGARVLPALKFNNSYSVRTFSNKNMSQDKVVSYEDVVTYKDRSDVLLIDVRDPQELQETGTIPGSINIPLSQLANTLQNSNPSDFKAKYGRDFPDKNANLVFSCKMGGRAGKAMDAAIQEGFVNSKFYKGSWQEWASKQ